MSRHKNRRSLPQYAERVIDKGLKALGAMGPGVYTLDVRHDSWCALLVGRGLCNCNPEVGEPVRIPNPEDN